MSQSVTGLREELGAALATLASAATPADRVAGVAHLLLVTGRDPRGTADLVDLCESDAAARATLCRALSGLFRESGILGLLAEWGLPNDRGLWQELNHRLARKLLPQPRDDHELARALAWHLPGRSGLGALSRFSEDELTRLGICLSRAGLDTQPLAAATADALLLLPMRISALGLTRSMRERMTWPSVGESPFHLLMLRTQELLSARERDEEVGAALAAWTACAEDVRSTCEVVRAHLEDAGVSLDLVFTIEGIEASLTRMELLLAVLAAPGREESARATARLWALLVAAWRDDGSLRALGRRNVHLLARRVVEHAGRTGEHYITTTRREYFAMLASAAGGGLVTAVTVVLKLVILSLGGPLFLQGVLSSLNFALSFLAIQHLGLTLATKQPSMTAAALAGIMQRMGADRIEELVTHVARIVRSQLAAAGSNIVFVTAGAWLFHWIWRQATGHAFMSESQVSYALESLNPWHSLTVFYAALTGVLLWVSSLIGGAIENWAAFQRLPEAIAGHRWGARLGADRMRRASRFVGLSLSGWGGNVSLGVLLGMTPALGLFFGIPLDVRHVTLSTGTLALAVFTLGPAAVHDPRLLPALVGIAIIFVLNLGVSFGLALWLAMRARDVPASGRRQFLAALRSRCRHWPLEFLFPPRDPRSEPVRRR